MKPHAPVFAVPLLLSCAVVFGCDEEKEKPERGAPDSAATSSGESGAEKSGEAAAPPPPADRAKEASAKAPASGNTGASCLAGKWHYDFADDAMETMMGNLPNAKLTKEEGELICDVSQTDGHGKIHCATSGKGPVVVEVSAEQAGMPLLISIEMSGKTTTDFKILDNSSLQLTSEGFGDLKMKVTARLAGNEFPFPATELLQGLGGNAGAISDFECAGDQLKVRPRIEGQSAWQILKRMK